MDFRGVILNEVVGFKGNYCVILLIGYFCKDLIIVTESGLVVVRVIGEGRWLL